MGYGKGKRKVKGKKEAETWMFASLSPQIFWHVLYESFILIAAAWCSQGSRLLCIGRTVGMLCNIPSFFFPSPYTATPYIELGLFMIVQLLFISFLAPSLRHRFGRSSPNFDARSTVTRIYKKTESEILGFSPPQKKIGGPQTMEICAKFRTTSQRDREYLRNETTKTALQPAISHAYEQLIWWT